MTDKAWADTARLPNEDDADAMLRRVKMHEYLMTGGVQLGLDKVTSKMIYSDPIETTDLWKPEHTDCPYHPGQDCTAWELIRSGNGFWTARELEREQLQDRLAEGGGSIVDADRAAELDGLLEFRPKRAPFEKQPKFIPKPKRDKAADRTVAKQEGNTKTKKPFPWSQTGNSDGVTAKVVKTDDARDTAFKELRSDEDAVIEFEGDE